MSALPWAARSTRKTAHWYLLMTVWNSCCSAVEPKRGLKWSKKCLSPMRLSGSKESPKYLAKEDLPDP